MVIKELPADPNSRKLSWQPRRWR